MIKSYIFNLQNIFITKTDTSTHRMVELESLQEMNC